MRGNRHLPFMGMALCIVLGSWVPGVAAETRVNAPILGDGYVYAVSVQGVSRIDYGLMSVGVAKAVGRERPSARNTSEIQTIRYDLSARLHARVVASDTSGVLVAARLQDVVYLVDGGLDSRQELLSMPFTLRYDLTGRIASFEFADRYPQEFRIAIQRLLEPLQVVAPAGASSTWFAEERDSDTAFTARYEAGTADPATGLATWAKTKTQVRPHSVSLAALPLSGAPSAQVNRSETQVTFDAARGALVHVRSSESVTTRVGRAFFSEYDTRFEATRVEAPLAALARSASEAEALRHDPVFARARLYDVDPFTRPVVEGVRLPDLVAAFRQNAPVNIAQATHHLSSWLRLNPASSLDVARQIDALDPKAEKEAFRFGWAALASAGHPEAQKALVAVATQPGWKPQSAHKALVAMMNLDAPEMATAQAVWKFRSRLAPDALRNLSLATNIYGILGDAQKGNAALTAQVIGNLARLLAHSDPRSRILALDALSNVGDLERVAPLAAVHLLSTDARVRSAAFGTFRRMTGDAAFQRFAVAFAAETQRDVRREAARVADQMEPTAARNAWAADLVAMEADPRVQSELVQILGRGLARFPENARTLRDLLKTTHDRSVRRDIYTYVAPIALGGAR